MKKEDNTIPEEENPDNNSENNEEDLLYTHKPKNQGNSMQWNSTFCRKPGR